MAGALISFVICKRATSGLTSHEQRGAGILQVEIEGIKSENVRWLSTK